jgi:hypothetical protein
LESLIKTDFGGIEAFLCLGINGATKEFKDYLRNYVTYVDKRFFSSVHVFDGDKNFGKPKIINMMAEKYNNFDYLVSMDSDMVSIDKYWLKKFLYAFDLYSGDYQLAGMAAAQEGNNCHFVQDMETCQKFEINKDLHLLYTLSCVGVAGGVLISKQEIWKYFEGYGAKNIYGDDDSSFALKAKYCKKIFPVLLEVKFYHPYSDNEAYSKWKLKSARGKLEEKESGFFEDLREK